MKMQGETSGYDRHTRSFMVVASTPNPVRALDADGNPIQEALVGWDLERFLKNPVILFAHDAGCIPVGKASEVEVMSDGGLKMRITLRPAGRSPLVDEIAGAFEDDVLRGISVGYEPGSSTQRANGTWERRNNELAEVSIVPVPADADAGNVEINPNAVEDDEAQRARVSKAASELAKARAKKRASQPRTDSVQRFDAGGRLKKAKPTSFGGAYIPARLSRIGVLSYRLADGTTRRELRHPDEVFKADSLATLADVPVIDIKDHTTILSPDEYKRATVGHLKSYRHDGKFIEGELVVQDGATLDAIDDGVRTEISCGYACRLDMTPGVYEGEAYDCVQRDIRYNHVALCPPNRGRAGPEVALRLDQNNPAASSCGFAHIDDGDNPMIKIKLDGRDFDYGSEAHLDKVDELHKKALAAAVSEAETKLDAADKAREEAVKERDALQGKLDASEKARESAAKAAEADKASAEDERKRAASTVKARLRKFIRALVLREMGETDDGEDEKKMDALVDAAFSDEGAQAFMVSAIQKSDPEFKSDGKTPEYIEGRFDALEEIAQKTRGVDSVLRAAVIHAAHLDADSEDPVEKSRKKMLERNANAWKGEPAKGA